MSKSWRVGTKLGRTLYREGKLVGMVDTPEIAEDIVNVMNKLGICRRCKTEIGPGYSQCASCADQEGP